MRYFINFFLVFLISSVYLYSDDCSCPAGYVQGTITTGSSTTFAYKSAVQPDDYCDQKVLTDTTAMFTQYSYKLTSSDSTRNWYSVSLIKTDCTKCNLPDQPVVVPVGYSNPYSIMSTQSSGQCPVVDTGMSNQCVAAGGVILTARSNCCSINYCALPDNNVTNCASDEHYDIQTEQCVCNNGYPMINGQCQVPHCPYPDDATNFPLRFENVSESGCADATLGQHQYVYKVYSDVNLSCCYIDPLYSDNNDTNTSHECPVGYYYSTFYESCRPLDSDNNVSGNNITSHECSVDYYYSIETERCEPFYSDNNSTDNNTTGDNSDNSDNNGSSSDALNDDLEDLLDDLNQTINQNHDDDLASIVDSFEGLKETIDQAMDGYVSNYESLQDVISGTAVPRSNLHGSCNLSVTVFHKKVDLSQGFIKFAPVARPLIMLFMNIYLTLILLRVALWAYRDVSQKILIMFGH